MREPSIHISRKALIYYLQKHGHLELNDLDDFMIFSRKYSLDHRSLHTKSKKIQEKAERRVKSKIGDANLLADIIYSSRIKLKHIGVTKIKQTSPQWGGVKELAVIVNQFCEAHGLTKRAGYIEYITTGIRLFSSTNKPNYSFLIKWLTEKADWITQEYLSIQEINEDNDPDSTRAIHEIYCTKVTEMTGVNRSYAKDTQAYVNFIKARELSDELQIDFETFIDAQFEALAFCNGIPNLKDLWGDKARERLVRYMSNNKLYIDNSDNKESKRIDWSKFKQ